MSRENASSSSGGLQIQTLLISAVSAVVAATVVPMFWERGTVIATAMTPVVVALVAEALRRPVAKVTAVAPKVTAVRQRSSATVPARGRPSGPVDEDPHDFRPVVDDAVDDPIAGVSADDPFNLRTPARRPWWKIGLITGLLAFVLGAGIVTASELTIFGGSVSGDRGRTTLFGGSTSSHKSKSSDSKSKPKATATPSGNATATPTATATPPRATATPSATATPGATATPAPSTAAAPSATPTP